MADGRNLTLALGKDGTSTHSVRFLVCLMASSSDGRSRTGFIDQQYSTAACLPARWHGSIV